MKGNPFSIIEKYELDVRLVRVLGIPDTAISIRADKISVIVQDRKIIPGSWGKLDELGAVMLSGAFLIASEIVIGRFKPQFDDRGQLVKEAGDAGQAPAQAGPGEGAGVQ